MTQMRRTGLSGKLERFSELVTDWTGGSSAFGVAAGVIAVWAVVGPVFHYSDTWQLVINTGTTIVTFLMVFLIQRSQNKASLAMQLKLNELVAALEGASNRLIDIESLSEPELAVLRRHFSELARLAGKQGKITDTHSVEEARERHSRKLGSRSPRTTPAADKPSPPDDQASPANNKSSSPANNKSSPANNKS